MTDKTKFCNLSTPTPSKCVGARKFCLLSLSIGSYIKLTTGILIRCNELDDLMTLYSRVIQIKMFEIWFIHDLFLINYYQAWAFLFSISYLSTTLLFIQFKTTILITRHHIHMNLQSGV